MPLESNNMHYKYKKEYFDKTLDGGARMESANECIFCHEYPQDMSECCREFDQISGCESFSLYTLYPGLMVGTGELHSNKEKEALMGGFSFDYTTGIPVIPGATLKGMLRSYFEAESKTLKVEKQNAIRSILGKEESFQVDALLTDIFDHNDIFLGGFPVCKGEQIFEEEYITPHKDTLQNPIPLKLLKVKPGVEYQFYFILHDYQGSDQVVVTAAEKMNLFKELLLLGGIGAKTNVGFGQLTEHKPRKPLGKRKKKQLQATPTMGSHKTEKKSNSKNEVVAVVSNVVPYGVFLKAGNGIKPCSRIKKESLGAIKNCTEDYVNKKILVRYLGSEKAKNGKEYYNYECIAVKE